MPTVTLNKKVFEELVGKKLPLEELKDRISMLGTDLEGIENDEIHVEVFPNRPDMLSEQGFARAFSSFIGVKTGLQKYKVQSSGMKVIVDKSVDMRPYTACAIVKNLKFNDERIREIMQMQEKLATTHGRGRKKSAYGIYPINNVTFPINYIAKDPKEVMFQPLGFSSKIKADQVIDQHPTGQKYKDIAKNWTKYPFFIDATDNVMCMLPFTNSNDTGRVDLNTTEVFIECSGVDQNNVTVALNMFVTMLADMGGDIYSIDIEYPNQTITTPNLDPTKMKLDLEYTQKILGINLNESKAQELLEKMGFGYEKGEVLIPAYRNDILHQADFVEDIAIAYGYENFEEEIPNVATIGEEKPLEIIIRKIRENAIGLKLLEVKNFHLTRENDLNEKMSIQQDAVGLLNAIGEQNHLRNALLPSLLKNLSENQHHEYPQNIFEIGRVFEKGETETGVIEKENLAIVTCHDKTDFTEMRQILGSLCTSLGLECSIKEIEHPSYIKGRAGNIIISKEHVGIIGEINPEVLQNWELMVPVVALELDIEKIFNLIEK